MRGLLANSVFIRSSHILGMLDHHKTQKFNFFGCFLIVIQILSEDMHARAPHCSPVYFFAMRKDRPRPGRSFEVVALYAHLHHIVHASDVNFPRRGRGFSMKGGSKEESHLWG